MSYKVWKDEPFYFAPIKKLGGGWIAFKDSPAPPPAPDYTGAATATAAGNAANLQAQTAANRPNQITPWGTSTWTDGGNNNWTQNITLSPSEQAALTDQQSIQANQSHLAQTMQGQVASTMKDGFNAPKLTDYTKDVGAVQQHFDGFNPNGVNPVNQNAPQFSDATAQAGAQAAYHSQMDLLQPQMDQDTKNLDSKLRLQGLTPGTEAYNTAAQNLGRTQSATQTQVANQAVLSGNQMANTNYASSLAGYGAGNAAQGQAYGQSLAGYGADQSAVQASNAAQGQAQSQSLQNYGTAYSSALQNYLQPLNSMNAVISGQQVQSPTMPSFASAGYTPGADQTGATSALGSWNQGLYNSQAASAANSNSSTLSTVGTIGAAVFL
jgi:hypothetical protein